MTGSPGWNSPIQNHGLGFATPFHVTVTVSPGAALLLLTVSPGPPGVGVAVAGPSVGVTVAVAVAVGVAVGINVAVAVGVGPPLTTTGPDSKIAVTVLLFTSRNSYVLGSAGSVYGQDPLAA